MSFIKNEKTELVFDSSLIKKTLPDTSSNCIFNNHLYKILVFSWLHPKNVVAIKKYKQLNITFATTIHDYNLLDFDFVYFPSSAIDISYYPNTKFIFGPHFSVFPNEISIQKITGPNTVYIQPSQWTVDCWKLFPICKNLKMNILPFGVDTETFKPDKEIYERESVFIYFKRRNDNELNYIMNFLSSLNIQYRIFDYVKTYSENDYIEYMKNSKYGIWLDAHESQGFAFEEALSCNVPILVWNVTSMNQEVGGNYPNVPATSIPYWDASCGEVFYNYNEFESTFHLFLSKLHTYCPREYILNHLSIEKCEKKFIDLLSTFTE
jgi:glycosyltransferase involved in cell wall biosynthesis